MRQSRQIVVITHVKLTSMEDSRQTDLVTPYMIISAFEICLNTRQLLRLLLREICVFSVCLQIIAEAKLS